MTAAKLTTALSFVLLLGAACGPCPDGERLQESNCRTEILPSMLAPDGLSIGSGLKMVYRCDYHCVKDGQ